MTNRSALRQFSKILLQLILAAILLSPSILYAQWVQTGGPKIRWMQRLRSSRVQSIRNSRGLVFVRGQRWDLDQSQTSRRSIVGSGKRPLFVHLFLEFLSGSLSFKRWGSDLGYPDTWIKEVYGFSAEGRQQKSVRCNLPGSLPID